MPHLRCAYNRLAPAVVANPARNFTLGHIRRFNIRNYYFPRTVFIPPFRQSSVQIFVMAESNAPKIADGDEAKGDSTQAGAASEKKSIKRSKSIDRIVAEYTTESTREAVQNACLYCEDSVAAIKALQEHGFEANDHNGYIPPAIVLAVESANEPLVSYLLSIGADPNMYHEHEAPLQEAARSTEVSLSILEQLLDHGAKLGGNEGIYNELADAADAGYLGKVELLLQRGAEPSKLEAQPQQDKALAQGTALQKSVAQHLFDTNPRKPPTYPPSKKWDPSVQLKIIETLLTAGADPSVVDSQGRSTAEWIASGPGYREPTWKKPVEYAYESDSEDEDEDESDDEDGNQDGAASGEPFDKEAHVSRIKALLDSHSKK